MPETAQSFSNHTKFDPPFHFLMAPVFLINLIWQLVEAVRYPSSNQIWIAIVSFAALVAIFKIRIYSLKVQDRVIRLEERLRLMQVLPEPLRSRIPELSVSQLVGLRFAPDSELPALVEKTLSGALPIKEIKKQIVVWRPDLFRV